MSQYILLICKRLLILALTIALSAFTLFMLYPFVDNHTPVAVAVVLTYLFLAYLGLPALLRIYHALHKPTHVPTRTHAADGWAVDAVNIVVVAGDKNDFVWAMQKAGWHLADDKTIKTFFRMFIAVLFNRPYPQAPFGNYYVFGRKQDLGFQIPVGNSPRNRHHVRFWQLGNSAHHEHHGFWQRLLKKFLHPKKQIWVGAAILDRGLNVRWRNLQINHGIESDTALERDFLVASLKKAGVLKDCISIKAGEPLHTRHQGFGETIIADGFVALCELKHQLLPPVILKKPFKKKG